jgi:hypothetical protein
MSDTHRFKYAVTLEWHGEVEVDAEPDEDEDELREAALDLAIDDALSSPAAYMVSDYDLEDVTERV